MNALGLSLAPYRYQCALAIALLLCLNACTTSQVIFDGYYEGVDPSDRESLLNHLQPIKHAKAFPGRKAQWEILERIHETPSEPAQLTTYYSQRSIEKAHRASGADASNNDYWNREHLWPKSYGLKGTRVVHDMHNIVAADRTVNSSRGNKYFDIGGRFHHECKSCLADRNSWEPPGDVKGDIARALMYMDITYDGLDASGAGDLVLVGDKFDKPSIRFGPLARLLAWHCEDAVSSFEIRRNDIIFDVQGNRNPFVDHPEWVDVVYEHECS